MADEKPALTCNAAFSGRVVRRRCAKPALRGLRRGVQFVKRGRDTAALSRNAAEIDSIMIEAVSRPQSPAGEALRGVGRVQRPGPRFRAISAAR